MAGSMGFGARGKFKKKSFFKIPIYAGPHALCAMHFKKV
jgi:hypothetical protein